MPGMTDTLDFVKNLWGSMNIPGTSLSGMSGPTLSTEDLDKRIADLKAVESWLNVNVTMLRGTIQTMEVQRATLATLKSMGSSMAEVMRQSGLVQPAAGAEQNPAQGAAAATGMPVAMAWWNMLQEQFTQAVSAAMAPPDAAAKAEPQGAAPAAPQQQQQQKQPAADGPASGNGKERASKPKTDKT
jgi:hypothetical protein